MRTGTAPRIMIVESYGGNIKSLSCHLASFAPPLEIIAETEPTAALARLEREAGAIDLVIIDTLLRGKMDGFELCGVIRKSKSSGQIPIILLLSGYLSLERYKGMTAGADLLLHRPVVREELFKMIQVLLEWKEESRRAPLVPMETPPLRVATSIT